MKLDKRVVYVATTLMVLVAAAIVSILCMPLYYVMLSDAIPPSMAVKLKRTRWLPDDALQNNETQVFSEQPTATLQQQTAEPAPATPDVTGIQADTPVIEDAKPVTEAVTVTENLVTASEPPEQSPIVSGGAADEVKQATVQSGHGVASDPLFQHRQPQTVSDPESLKDEDYLIDSEVMHKVADKDGYIMVTWANNHYYDFVKNWVAHVEGLGITSFVVGAMDNIILAQLLRDGIPCFSMQSGLTSKDYGWGSPSFHKMGRKKINLVQAFTELNLTVIISDVDTVWMRNPFEYMKRYPEADILTSSDYLAWTHTDEGLEDVLKAGSAYNIGIMMFSPKALDFAKEWVAVIEADDNIWDQNAFNDLARRGMKVPEPTNPLYEKRLFLGNNGNLVVGILPTSIFASGHTFFVSKTYEQLGLDPYVVHATFQFSGTPGKRNRLREFMLWHDEPEYYQPGHGFVTWDMDAPAPMVQAAVPNPPSLQCCETQQGHFDLMNHQLLQTRNGLAIASVLGLGIIIPQFTAGLDRYWAPHMGTIPGSATKLPYKAPIDHVLDLERMLGREKPFEEFGPNIPYREYSFLDNPACPDEVKSNQVAVNVCTDPQPHCSDGSAAAELVDGALWVRGGLDDVQLRTALGDAAKAYTVLKFNTTMGLFSRHVEDVDHQRFANRVKQMASIWCCVQPEPGKPGHVWYDMWWDTIPHTDLHNRLWNESWHIVTGP